MPRLHRVTIGLGANLAPRVTSLNAAFAALQAQVSAPDTVARASHVYESDPMYDTDQPRFLNAVVQCTTALSARQVLDALKGIERALGRVPSDARNGPRQIDLDVLFHGDAVVDEAGGGGGSAASSLPLTVPHPRLAERAFVLRPLVDVDPDLVDPVSALSATQLLASLHASTPPALDGTVRVAPVAGDLVLPLGTGPPHVMGILNATPDSFSDGGLHHNADGDVAQAARGMAADGAALVDVGGESTR